MLCDRTPSPCLPPVTPEAASGIAEHVTNRYEFAIFATIVAIILVIAVAIIAIHVLLSLLLRVHKLAG